MKGDTKNVDYSSPSSFRFDAATALLLLRHVLLHVVVYDQFDHDF